MWDFLDVIGPARDDDVSQGTHLNINLKSQLGVSFWTGDRWAWWMAISNAISGPGLGLKHESVSGRAISLPEW